MLASRYSARLFIVLALGLVSLGPVPRGTTPAWAQASSIPQLALWESQMLTYGQRQGDALASWLASYAGGPIDGGLIQTYYDRARVMYQIADYTGNANPWNGYAKDALRVYRDLYVLKYCSPGSYVCIPGYWNFTTGLRMDYERTGDVLSKQAAIILSTGAAYCNPLTGLASTIPFGLSREVAYCILGFVDAEALGEPRSSRRQTLVDQAYGHLDQIVVRKVWQGTADQASPFMIAITAQALIRDWEQTGDPRLLPALQAAADFMWSAWVPAASAMQYDVNPGSSTFTVGPAPDLNLIIAPVYAWLFAQTGDTASRDRGDALFAGGVTQAWLDGAKQFNQNYWWSFDYVKWRSAATMSPTSPSIRITSPSTGESVSGTVTVSTAATETVAITRVDYLIDSQLVGAYSPPVYSMAWNTANSTGQRTLKAKAYDSSGNVAESAPVTVTVVSTNVVSTNPVPVLTQENPSSRAAGSKLFVLTVTGSNFVPSSVIQWNGSPRATTYVSRTQLTANIAASDIATPGTVRITVFTPAPGGGTSSALTFGIKGKGWAN